MHFNGCVDQHDVFLYLMEFLGDQSVDDKDGVKDSVTLWLTLYPLTFFYADIQTTVCRYNKCLNVLADFVEK